MSSSPPSVGNRVKLDPLSFTINNVAYNSGYIELATVEPSLGLPNGFTNTQIGSSYYFPVFGIADSYLNSRRFTGNDSLVFKNKNLGINNPDPTYNVDVSGTIRANVGFFEAVNVNSIVGSETLTFQAQNGIRFQTPVYFDDVVYFKDIISDNVTASQINANILEYQNTLVQVYNLASADISTNLNISANLTASNIFANNSLLANNVQAVNSNFDSLQLNNAIVQNDVNVINDVYANRLYGKVQIDDSSQLFYNANNELSVSKIKDYYFVIRPSDSYSTDNINIARTLDGPKDDGTIEDNNILKPFFKNVQAVIDYIYTNGIYGNNLYIWIDEDITAGEDRPNEFTPDRSGQYSGCTVTGNISATFLSNEYLINNLPAFYENAGLRGGDYIWAKNNNADLTGTFYYIELYSINFNNIVIQGRYEIGTFTNNNGLKQYTTWKPFNYPVRTILFRTYICTDPSIPFGSFDNTGGNTWTEVNTRTKVEGRQVQFNQSQPVNLTLRNLYFAFETNCVDSTGLVFYDGTSNIQNVTVALKGYGVYPYGALSIESEYANVNICGTPLLDPYFVNYNSIGQSAWNQWSSYGFDNPNYFPGYGLAIVGNPFPGIYGTIINYNEPNPYSGFINIRNGGQLRIQDDSVTSRTFGFYSYIQNSIILDGSFTANTLFNLDNKASLRIQQNMFKTSDFRLSPNFVLYNNKTNTDSFKISLSSGLNNFKYINFNGSFATFQPNSDNTVTNWTFKTEDAIQGPAYNTFLTIDNERSDPFYLINSNLSPFSVTLNNSINSIGRINFMGTSLFNTNNIIYYVGLAGIRNYNEPGLFNLNSPTLESGTNNYILNFKTEYTR
jgi:hypothetical protein